MVVGHCFRQSERIRVLVLRGRRINLLLALGRSRRLLFRTDFKDGVAATRAKSESGLLAKQGRRHATIAISLDM